MILFNYQRKIGDAFVPNCLHQEHKRFPAWLNQLEEFSTDYCAYPLEKLLKTKNVPVLYNLSCESPTLDQPYLIPIENLYSSITYLYPERCPEFNFWDTLAKHFKEDLKQGRAYLLFTELKRIFEGPRGDLFINKGQWFSQFYKILQQKNIPAKQCIVIMPVPEFEKLHDDYCHDHQITKENQIIPRFLNFYEMAWCEVSQQYRSDEKISTVEEIRNALTTTRPKHFLFQNNESRYHRRAFFSWLHENNLRHFGHISFLNRVFNTDLEKNFSLTFNNDELNGLIYRFERIKSELPLVLDTSEVHLTDYSSWPFNESYFSIIAERIFNSSPGWTLPTSKIYKTIESLHPFILLAQPGTLRHLKSLGYKSFPNFFDESYDDILCPVERFKFIQKEVKKLCTLKLEDLQLKYQNVFENLVHNRNLLNKRWEDSEFHNLISFLDLKSHSSQRDL